MNCILTEYVIYRGRRVHVSELKNHSNIKIQVTCCHNNIRELRWCKRHQWCRQCSIEAGVYNTSPKGRNITWGYKISKAKKGKQFTEEHKQALVEARKQKYCEQVGIDESEFVEFSSYSAGRFNFNILVRQCIIHNWDLNSMVISEFHHGILDVLEWNLLEFKEHMEKQFDPNMSWDNYGYWGWHVDHIKPVSMFHIVSIYDAAFRECWNLKNLQPLWANDNFKKNNKYDEESTRNRYDSGISIKRHAGRNAFS